ncbi:MAG TPA: phosphatase [Rhodobacteraceae bacterium]|nr:HAD family hydrolase [Paracoccaceae bacterium]HBH00044.1 phosphatase [Paracoccaceae bacterium]
MIRGIIFDKDGTLFDFQASWADWTARLLDRYARGDAEGLQALAARIGFDPVSRRFQPGSVVIAGTPQDMAAALLPAVPGATARDLIADMIETAEDARLVPVADLRPILVGLRDRGLTLGLATNDAEASARAHLRDHGVADLFTFVAGYDSGYGGKPDPGQLRGFLRAAGFAPEEVLMVGDSRHDLAAARAAGLHAVGVLTGVAQMAELAPLADAVLPGIAGLAAWLDEQMA